MNIYRTKKNVQVFCLVTAKLFSFQNKSNIFFLLRNAFKQIYVFLITCQINSQVQVSTALEISLNFTLLVVNPGKSMKFAKILERWPSLTSIFYRIPIFFIQFYFFPAHSPLFYIFCAMCTA